MPNFDLLQQLQNPEADIKNTLPKGIKYDQFDVVVENETIPVYIPHRESEAFAQFLSENQTLKYEELKDVLRKVRGIRG